MSAYICDLVFHFFLYYISKYLKPHCMSINNMVELKKIYVIENYASSLVQFVSKYSYLLSVYTNTFNFR